MTFTETFTVALLTSYTYVYIHVSHVYKLACTLHRIINLLPLFHVCPVLPHPTTTMDNRVGGGTSQGGCNVLY
jgi:hypothetical protein